MLPAVKAAIFATSLLGAGLGLNIAEPGDVAPRPTPGPAPQAPSSAPPVITTPHSDCPLAGEVIEKLTKQSGVIFKGQMDSPENGKIGILLFQRGNGQGWALFSVDRAGHACMLTGGSISQLDKGAAAGWQISSPVTH